MKNIVMGKYAGMNLTDENRVIVIGDNTELRGSKKIAFGKTVLGIPIPTEFKRAVLASPHNAYHIIHFVSRVMAESRERNRHD
jgi:hypothetical protein